MSYFLKADVLSHKYILVYNMYSKSFDYTREYLFVEVKLYILFRQSKTVKKDYFCQPLRTQLRQIKMFNL
jgi:hypothetical protein